VSTKPKKPSKEKTMTKAKKTTVPRSIPKIDVKHPGMIVETIKGDVWIDTMTLSLMLGVSPYTWAGVMCPQAEEHYGDRNLFRRVKGRNALWNWRMIHRWYVQRPAPKRGSPPVYIQRLGAMGARREAVA
jgi:hypothetical protein